MMPQTHEHLRPRPGDLYESDCFSDTCRVGREWRQQQLRHRTYSSEFHILMISTAIHIQTTQSYGLGGGKKHANC
jgi:hypothetical protein